MKFRLFFIALHLSICSMAQGKNDCFEIKYLDFFGLFPEDDHQWGLIQLDELLTNDLANDEMDKARKTHVYIPNVVHQLREFYPGCSRQMDTLVYGKLMQLYFKWRKQDLSIIYKLSVPEQLHYIRKDFYDQVADDSLLPYMIFSFNAGPLFGRKIETIPDYKKAQAYELEFGTIYITPISDSVYISVENREGKHLWSRLMTTFGDRPIQRIGFVKGALTKNSLGYILFMPSEGERLGLYLKADGAFRFYYLYF